MQSSPEAKPTKKVQESVQNCKKGSGDSVEPRKAATADAGTKVNAKKNKATKSSPVEGADTSSPDDKSLSATNSDAERSLSEKSGGNISAGNIHKDSPAKPNISSSAESSPAHKIVEPVYVDPMDGAEDAEDPDDAWQDLKQSRQKKNKKKRKEQRPSPPLPPPPDEKGTRCFINFFLLATIGARILKFENFFLSLKKLRWRTEEAASPNGPWIRILERKCTHWKLAVCGTFLIK